MKQEKFTRQELYTLVWSKPLSVLAKEYQISDNGLRKKCKAYNIPLPKMGHWNKVKFNKKLEVIPLPKKKGLKTQYIILNSREHNENNEEHILTKLARITSEIRMECPTLINVKDKLIKPDILVLEAREDLKTKKPRRLGDHFEAVRASVNVLRIHVAKENVQRSLCFMDAFIKLAQKRGHEIVNRQYGTIIIVYDQKYNIRLREKCNRLIVKDGRWERSELIPNGKFSFKFEGYPRKEWSDGKIKIEKHLSKILATIEIRAEEGRIRSVKNDLDRKVLEKLRQQKLWEKEKVRKLVEHSDNWKRSNDLKKLIEEVENTDTNQNEELKDWLIWAKTKTKELNPLGNGVEAFIKEYEFSLDSVKRNKFHSESNSDSPTISKILTEKSYSTRLGNLY